MQTENDVQQWRTLLESERKQLLATIDNLNQSAIHLNSDQSGDISRFPTHIADLAIIEEESERMMSVSDQELKRLHAIDAALQRLDEGTFGVCANCGENISSKRLQVIPESSLCIQCGTELEKAAH